MWRITVVVFIAVAAAGAGRAELCGVDIEMFKRPEETHPRWEQNCRSHDFFCDWRLVWLDLPEAQPPEGFACLLTVPDDPDRTGCAGAIDWAGDELDRWWYVYLDRQHYRFLDVTQYNLLGGPPGYEWRWGHGVWPDVFWLPAPVRCGRQGAQPIPESATAALLAFGAVVLLRAGRSEGTR
ncbi:MAG TPA: hypothetical protein PLU87_06830 [Sedimentisphaerales bacterium]|nr:hypothetical protein [Sedimentisphaerales bacterium]HRS10566.1 hypothetical protein [Sedimentisphaerales bacterium]HRV47210.1 hypothetical protein [Sedimentisphaerales bacterium]